MLEVNNQDWLKHISDDQLITSLSIPGTHDTMTETCNHIYYKTQFISLIEQFNMGVRFLDIRLTRNLVAAHREWISDISGQSIFDTAKSFLAENPSEFIIMRIQNANEHKDDFPEYKKAIHSLIKENLDHLLVPELVKGSKNIYAWPKMKEARGKIIAIECAPSEFNVPVLDGVRWAHDWHQNERINLQDNWDGPEVHDKLNDIRNLAMKEQQTDEDEELKLYLNHISATNGELGNPKEYADILNQDLLGVINEIESANKVEKVVGKGIYILDFIEAELSKDIIMLNEFNRN